MQVQVLDLFETPSLTQDEARKELASVADAECETASMENARLRLLQEHHGSLLGELSTFQTAESNVQEEAKEVHAKAILWSVTGE